MMTLPPDMTVISTGLPGDLVEEADEGFDYTAVDFATDAEPRVQEAEPEPGATGSGLAKPIVRGAVIAQDAGRG